MSNLDMFHGGLLLIAILLASVHSCPETTRDKSTCVNGTRSVEVTYWSKQANGTCKSHSWSHQEHCFEGVVPKLSAQTCLCTAFGDPYFRTFDGAVFRFPGRCSYVLAQSNPTNQCAFTVVGSNSDNGEPYLNAIKIDHGGDVVVLGHGNRLYVNKEFKTLPYKKPQSSVEIFVSGSSVTYLDSKCGILVKFNGRESASIELNKTMHQEKVVGLCGDCNGRQEDDFKTKDGLVVTNMKDRSILLGDSWIDIREPCSSLKTQSIVNATCPPEFERQLYTEKQYCGPLTDPNGIFSKGPSILGYADACVQELCQEVTPGSHGKTPQMNRLRMNDVRCSVMASVAELLEESGVEVGHWREEFSCPMICNANEEFVYNASPVDTCEKHFFGKDKKEIDLKLNSLPKASACVCKQGFLLDGLRCVSPSECTCLKLCTDEAPPDVCKEGKARNQCTKLPEYMTKHCRLTCGFCKPDNEKCVDRVSSQECAKYLERGECANEFGNYLCSLTCNKDKCNNTGEFPRPSS
ncbi:hypothetical protein Ciccas_006991 [Cichlidogyrus casuarinus]|uniref:Uncharacterized protein n=1 Tax=Cichlidogyrus casuarinus TaxID=1844966 RepID=A0ABD2Q465_9PLAT